VQALVEDRLRLAVHEIRQPVSAVFALAEAARGLPGVTGEISAHLDRIIEQVQEVSAAASSVLSAGAGGDTGPVDLGEVLESVCAAVRVTWDGTLVRHGDHGRLLATGSRVVLRRCLVNVVDNAVRAAGPDGKVVIFVRRSAEAIRVDVEDDGPGFGHVPRVTGLGLAVTRQALEAVGGSLSVGLPSGIGGARVALVLPAWLAGDTYQDPPGRAV
jgi:signal transduction histidine kinase